MKEDFNTKTTPASDTLVPSVRDKDGTGYDIFSLLLKERVIVVQGQVETGMAGVIISQLKYLEALDPQKEITMLINSPGGSVIDGMAIYDIMRSVQCKIITVGNGMQASMGSILLAGGDERMMNKSSRVLVHQLMGGNSQGTQHTDLKISEALSADLHEELKSVYVAQLGMNHKFWDIVGERDSWLTAEQALAIGYIHGIVQEPEKKQAKYGAEAVRENEGLAAKLNETTMAHINGMTANEIKNVINDGNAEKGLWAGLRPQLIVKLAQFPEFWTEGKKAEVAAAKKLASSNDNVTTATSPAKKKSNGPTNG